MNIWLVSPAFRRPAVTRLALAGRRWLCDELERRGHRASSVIVADDENLQIADEYGFDTVRMGNHDLGAKFNAGYQYAANQGADLFVHIGSDDWVHPDAFTILEHVDLTQAPEPEWAAHCSVVRSGPQVVSQRKATIVDLTRGRMTQLNASGSRGCIPWLLPRCVLEKNRFAPLPLGLKRGMDGALARSLRARPNWIYQPSEYHWLVDFKSRVNITGYAGLARAIGATPETNLDGLEEHYPLELVEMARETAARLTRAAA